MRMLFEIDEQNYDPDGTVRKRPSARGIFICDGKIAMVHSEKYGYYKFPGGGIEPGESEREALVREVLEEAGMTVDEDSIIEYGQVRRIQKDNQADIFIQDNFYFFCDTKGEIGAQNLDEKEAEAGFILVFTDPQTAIEANRKCKVEEFSQPMVEREARVLEMLVAEGYFN